MECIGTFANFCTINEKSLKFHCSRNSVPAESVRCENNFSNCVRVSSFTCEIRIWIFYYQSRCSSVCANMRALCAAIWAFYCIRILCEQWVSRNFHSRRWSVEFFFRFAFHGIRYVIHVSRFSPKHFPDGWTICVENASDEDHRSGHACIKWIPLHFVGRKMCANRIWRAIPIGNDAVPWRNSFILRLCLNFYFFLLRRIWPLIWRCVFLCHTNSNALARNLSLSIELNATKLSLFSQICFHFSCEL